MTETGDINQNSALNRSLFTTLEDFHAGNNPAHFYPVVQEMLNLNADFTTDQVITMLLQTILHKWPLYVIMFNDP